MGVCHMLTKRAVHRFMHNLKPFLHEQRSLSAEDIEKLISALDSGGLSIQELHRNGGAKLAETVGALSRHGFLEFVTPGPETLVLTPCSRDFKFGPIPEVREGTWRVSRFTYSHYENGEYIVRNPNADCFTKVRSDDVAALVHTFSKPTDVADVLTRLGSADHTAAVCGALARAEVILPCDENGKTKDETDPARRQWAFHDLVFHSLSRLGRTEKEIGGTYRFKGELECLPAVKQHSWTDTVVPLPRADIPNLMYRDAPLTAVIELRHSTRRHSIVPLSKQQIGEFLFRVARVRNQYTNEYGDFTSRPYPGGGACYENEFYLTIEACIDIPRGFYYYDPVAHALCLVSRPNGDTAALLDEAWMATAQQCRPQVLVTIASRFNRFNWKYASMSYAAQLKNVGVIYQTMYLVATAMNIGACGLGMGNTERFACLTGLDYLEEGSVGEFMLGRPA
jgi:oxazoline/thiazoline dehydrogenase